MAEKTKKRGPVKTVLMLAVIGFNLWIIWIFLPFGGGSELTEEQQARRDEQRLASDARAACVTFIRTQLNNPDSAEWVSRVDWPVSIDSETGHLHVRATFRASNAFGGIVTERQTCIVRPTDGRPVAYRLIP